MSILKRRKGSDYLNQAIVDSNSLSKWNDYATRTGDTKVHRSSLGYNDNPLLKLLGLEKKKPKPRNPNAKRKAERETNLSRPTFRIFKKKGKEMKMWS